MHSLGVTSNAERFLEALHALQPQGPAAANPAEALQQQQQQPLTLSSSPASKPFDVGSLIAAAQALQHNTSGTPAAQPMHGGVLSSTSSSTPHSLGMSSTAGRSSLGGGGSRRSPEPQAMLRVVLVYCRSKLPAPVWQTHRDAGLAIDCLHIHDKPQPGEQQQQLQVRGVCANHALAAYQCMLVEDTRHASTVKLSHVMDRDRFYVVRN